MKRFAALAVLALGLYIGTAYADAIRITMQVPVRRGCATCLGGFQDSSYIAHTGAITDTSANFNVEDRAFTPYVLGADSLSLFDFGASITNGTTLTAAVDSFYVTPQGSYDGITWVSGVQVGLLSLAAASTQGTFYRGFQTTRLGSVTAAAATNLQLGPFRLWRVITQTSAVDKGKLQLFVSYWKATYPQIR